MTHSKQNWDILLGFTVLVTCWLALPTVAQSQFIDFTLEVNSKLTASTQQPLDFGTVLPNSGRTQIEFGSAQMGIFTISALERRLLLIELHKPEALQHDNPAITANVPLNLNANYGYSFLNYQNSIPLSQATSYITVETDPDMGPWNTLYIFMWGWIDIGDIPSGTYSNEIVLNVEYI